MNQLTRLLATLTLSVAFSASALAVTCSDVLANTNDLKLSKVDLFHIEYVSTIQLAYALRNNKIDLGDGGVGHANDLTELSQEKVDKIKNYLVETIYRAFDTAPSWISRFSFASVDTARRGVPREWLLDLNKKIFSSRENIDLVFQNFIPENLNAIFVNAQKVKALSMPKTLQMLPFNLGAVGFGIAAIVSPNSTLYSTVAINCLLFSNFILMRGDSESSSCRIDFDASLGAEIRQRYSQI